MGQSSYQLEWVWTATGWTLAAIGAALFVWALFWDRSRGRRRCPKCWYDMAGIVVREHEGQRAWVCPECGNAVSSERGLCKTRRRWRAAVLALLLLVIANLAGSEPGIRARGWWAAAPRPILAIALPWVPEGSTGAPSWGAAGALETEIQTRFLGAPHELRWLWPGESLVLDAASRQTLREGHSESAQVLAARLLVLLRADALTVSPPAGEARVALSKSNLLYARCKSYRDSGTVKGTIGIRAEQPFCTAFQRPGEFRFEYLGMHPHQSEFSMRYVVWGKEPAIHGWWTLDTNVRVDATVGAAIGGPTGVSGGSAYTVPSQLVGGLGLLSYRSPKTIGREEFDGHPCLVVRGMDHRGLPCDVWLDTGSFAIRKIHQHWEYPSTTVYRPEFDGQIPLELFTFDPLTGKPAPLGDGRAVSETLGILAGDPRRDAIPVPKEKRFKDPFAP